LFGWQAIPASARSVGSTNGNTISSSASLANVPFRPNQTSGILH
jgi:hypothetical protein